MQTIDVVDQCDKSQMCMGSSVSTSLALLVLGKC